MLSSVPQIPESSPAGRVNAAKTLLAVACCLVSAWNAAEAASLGDLKILSERGQALQAEVPVLDVDVSTADSLTISVGDQALSEAAGLVQTESLPFLWSELRQRDSGQWYVTVLSGKPIVDPYNEIILELVWPDGSYLREYAIRFGASTRPNQSTVLAAGTVAPNQASVDTTPQISPQARPETGSPSLNSVTVRSGDSLISVARSLALADVTNEQLMLAIYRSNPQAFAGSPDKLLAGVTLNIPSRAEISAIPADQASREIASTNRLAPTNTVSTSTDLITQADAVLQNNAVVVDETLTERDPTLALYSAEGSVVAERAGEAVTEANPAVEPLANLSLSRVVSVDTHDAVLQRQADNSLLTQQLAGLDESLSVVSSQLSNMESSVTALSETVEENTFKVSSLDVQIDGLQEVTNTKATVNNEVQLAAAQSEVPVTIASNRNLVEGSQGSIATVSTESRWREFMDSGYLRSLALLGIALALAVFMIARQVLSQRKKRAREALQAKSATTAKHQSTESQNDVDAEEGGADVRHPSALRRQEESVDTPTAMTWFREHLQSPKVGEEALVKALRHYPNRQDLRLRLMERYANRKEVESFAQLGREMFLMTRGRNKEWPQAIQLALALELEMESMEPDLVPSYRSVDLGVDRDIDSPFSGDSTQQFLAFSKDLYGGESANSANVRRTQGRRNPLRPDVRLDQTLV